MTAPSASTTLGYIRALQWLKDNPEFEEQPASIEEFLGPDYLNIASGVRAGVLQALIGIFGETANGHSIARVQQAMFTGAIGIGKTTLASIALPYMCHWVLCLRNPQTFFGLLPGSRIAFMQMSTSEDQAREVLFGDIFARITYSPWFKKYPHDPKFKNQIRFPKDIWIVPGDSAETTFEGYNILGGVIDEMDSHRVTPKKDYAEEGYTTISNRITSRFQDRGLLILIGQMKKATGFAARKYEELRKDEKAHVVRMAIWESFGWERWTNPDGTRQSFWFDKMRRTIVPDLVLPMVEDKSSLMEIPLVYRKDFANDPVKALRDQAGIPPIVGSPFIGMVDRIYAARDRWHKRFNLSSPTKSVLDKAVFESWFRAPDHLPRALHLDIAYSDTGDAAGIAMGHVPEVTEIDGEMLPVIVFDFLLRLRPIPGNELQLSDLRKVIYYLRDELQFRIKKVTMDGFESTDTMQQLQKRRFDAQYLSVDKKKLPYEDLREAIYDNRLEFPKYMAFMKHGDVELVEIAVRELEQLVDDGKKIDHPEGGSKDVADAMAGVCHSLMGDRRYRRSVGSRGADSQPPEQGSGYDGSSSPIPSVPSLDSLSNGAPMTPGSLLTLSGYPIPPHLRPGNGR